MSPHFFINRPVFATVLAIVITLVGAVSIGILPIALYPDVVPPVVQVTTSYPGAGAQTISDTVATPIEQQIVGVDNMLYMESRSTNTGNMLINVTFEIGTNPNLNQVLTQNRVAIANPQLPPEVQKQGVITQKQSPSILLAINLYSPRGRYDQLYLSNYALIQIKDELARLPGVGAVNMLGQRDYCMRLWLRPDELASRNMTAMEVIDAVRQQNVQVAAGQIGQPPAPRGQDFQYLITTLGRLVEKEEFENIIVRISKDGSITRLADVARVELGASDYSVNAYKDEYPSAMLAIFQLPGSNALAVADAVYKKLDELKQRFPDGLTAEIAYDTTRYINRSIEEVTHTFRDALLLVFAVVFIFLQNWRATIIPTLAIPVSIIGTFFVMALLGFSINSLSLFGLVLAIGIVVDDAIVVVENVERHLEDGMDIKAATHKALDEVSGPVIATALVLAAVFVPCAAISGLAGQFYRQFALTIAVSTIISAIVSLTFTPALCGLLLKPRHEQRDLLTRIINLTLGWVFKAFNYCFNKLTSVYGRVVALAIRLSLITLLGYGGLMLLTARGYGIMPTGFIPQQDQGYFIVQVQMPDGTSLERTDAFARRVAQCIRQHPDGTPRAGIDAVLTLPGYSFALSSNSYSQASCIVVLTPWDQREEPGLYVNDILRDVLTDLNAPTFNEGVIAGFGAPPIQGIGQGGLKLQVQDRGGAGLPELQRITQELIGKANEPGTGIFGAFTSFRSTQPQLYARIDRDKVRQMGVEISDVNSTLQAYLGAVYVNDFNRFGRTWRVYAQADAPYRDSLNTLSLLKVRNRENKMVPLDTVLEMEDIVGPELFSRYNMYPAAEVMFMPAPGYSSGQAIASMNRLAKEVLPPTMSYEWTDIAYLQTRPGTSALLIFALAIVFVYLVLAAQYENVFIPASVLLVVPLGLLGAALGILARGMENNIFVQIGLVLLIGLGSKNAILVVEFAKVLREQGKSIREAAVEAARVRLRPILMTAFAFILGVVPLMLSKGAGAEVRQQLGTAVFAGMLMLTLVGIFFTPVFYAVIQWLGERIIGPSTPTAPPHAATLPAHTETTPPAHNETTPTSVTATNRTATSELTAATTTQPKG